MKNEKYYVGLDIGTDSVGYAVTDERYDLCKFKGEHMWGVTLFDEAEPSANRRTFRTARRRLDRRQQRLQLLSELFAVEIANIDGRFFQRIKESYLYPENDQQKVRLFGSYKEQKEYMTKYPTIHHLIDELMCSAETHDPRLVYVACAWLIAHRGHFLSEVDKHNIEAVTDFNGVYQKLTAFIKRDEYTLPWSESIPTEKISDILRASLGVTKKSKALAELLFTGGKAPKGVDDEHEYNYDLIVKLLCGGKAAIKDLFDKDEYDGLEEKNIALNMEDEKLASIMQSIDEEDAELLRVLKGVYDWSVLADILKGKETISKAKVAVYEQHQKDLAILKYFIRTYAPKKYNDVFRSENVKNNYAAYIGKNQTSGKDVNVKKAINKEDFCKYVSSVMKAISPADKDTDKYTEILACLEANNFLPKQVDGGNRVIPYQLYWHELNSILENARKYLPFLDEKDGEGITVTEKILYIFEFRVPYYVGPLKENPDKNKKFNHWMVRKAEGKIYPWNFNRMVDLDASEEAFISRMTNKCTYLPGEDVLPKNSLLYCAFEVLNEINNIKINEKDIPIFVKQNIYENLFMQRDKVTPNHIKQYLISNGYASPDDMISGIDISIKSSLKPFRAFRNLVECGMLTYSDAERIINRATYSEDKSRFSEWLKKEYAHLPDSETKYISGLKFKEFGKLSKKLLCGIEGAINTETGEYMSIIRTMWETNLNFMQIIYSNEYEFSQKIRSYVEEYYGSEKKSVSDRLDDMYVSNSAKRPIIRSLDILKDIVKVQGKAPKMIFIEMARGATNEQKGKRSVTRLQQILDLYKKVDAEDVRHLTQQLEAWGDSAHNKLQSDKLFLYFIQLGKCLYTGRAIGLEAVIAGDGTYNIDHIRPRCYVKDDSIINNLVLVDSKENDRKKDGPVPADIISNMKAYWTYLNSKGLLSDEKLRRLTRATPFTDDEKFEFINRQLVETRQSTKALAALLNELYPDTEIVYVKAGIVSDFRQQFDLVKSRAVNDLHHAKDAYLNIVCGNVWHHKFSRRFWRDNESNNCKPEIVFTHPVVCGDKTIWSGATDKDRIVKTARRNTPYITVYSYCKHSGQNGGFFDQNPLKAKEGLIPLKKDMPTELYGGYDSATVSGFVLARYKLGKKTEVSFVPLKFLHMKQFLESDIFATQYLKQELGENATDIEPLLNKRIVKISSTISIDGARFCIRGKAGLSDLGLMNLMPLLTSYEWESYIKNLESFEKKHQNNENLVWDKTFDVISKEKNQLLYQHYIEKLSQWPYCKRPGNTVFVEKLRAHVNDFCSLDVLVQTKLLLQIQGVLGRAKLANLEDIKESSNSGIAKMSMKLSNWKKSYTDARIVDVSASGLFEHHSDNILELL